MNSNISIIIPNYNGEDLLKKNLGPVLAAKNNKKNNIGEIIIVDDGSIDGSVKLIKKDFSEIRLIIHKKNRGFSAAINTGVRASRGQFVCLLNTDVVPNENFLKNIDSVFLDDKVFGVSLHEQGYGPSKGIFKNGYLVHEPKDEKKIITQTFWVSGGSGVFSKIIWKKVGWLDEELFSPFYWEDVDICYRAMKRGYKLLWCPNAKVSHEHEGTTSKMNKKYRSRIEERNQLLFVWKNLTSPPLFRKHILGLLKRILRHPGYIRIFFMAFSKILKVSKLRKKERRECKVSDEAILSYFK